MLMPVAWYHSRATTVSLQRNGELEYNSDGVLISPTSRKKAFCIITIQLETLREIKKKVFEGRDSTVYSRYYF